MRWTQERDQALRTRAARRAEPGRRPSFDGAMHSAIMKERWKMPEYRLPMLEILAENRAKMVSTLPVSGTPERRQYNKIRSILGAKAARAALVSP